MRSEHVHEYHEIYEVLTADGRRIKAWCIDYKECDGVLSEKEIMRRLNATERLSAEAARETSHALRQLLDWATPILLGKKPNITRSELLEYAAALEGEDA